MVGERVSGKSVIWRQGSHPFIPPIPGINDVDYLTTDNFSNLKGTSSTFGYHMVEVLFPLS